MNSLAQAWSTKRGRVMSRPQRELPETDNQWKLTPTEYHIGLWLGDGLTITEIAARLCIAPKTVSTYIARGRDKTGATNNEKYAVMIALHAHHLTAQKSLFND